MHEWIFSFLVSEQYQMVSGLLPEMILAGGLFAAGQMLALKLMSEMKSSSMLRVKIYTALMGILFNLIGVYLAGLYGIVLAAVAFSVTYLLWMFILSYRVVAADSADCSLTTESS